ncbi:MAG TPA: cytochrome c, partial [Candidatus Polarisedimenticolia bacterium]|nr:cytochrome c [Candidatus Polarisedimenticolia bacterium]
RSRTNPVPPGKDSLAEGARLYADNCRACHGEDGKGHGPVARRMGFSAGDLTASGEAAGETDGAIRWKIATGRDPMPGFAGGKRLTETEIWILVRYLRSLQSGSAPPPGRGR